MSLQLSMNFKKHIWSCPAEYKDLSGAREIAIDLIHSTKPSYLAPQKSITFTKNISYYYMRDGGEYKSNLGGYNTRRGHIYIRWTDNENRLRQTLAHELLHTFIQGEDDFSHAVVYDLSNVHVEGNLNDRVFI